MLTARQYLDVNMPAEAVAALEAEIANADGNKSFLTLLREAYLAELVRLEKAPATDDARIAQVRRHLALLGGAAPTSAPPAPAATPAPATAPEPATTPVIPPPSFDPPVLVPAPTGAETVGEAVALFNKKDYAAAAKLFAASAANLTDMQKAAWAFARVWVANEKLKAAGCDSAAATALSAEVAEALKLAPATTSSRRWVSA